MSFQLKTCQKMSLTYQIYNFINHPSKINVSTKAHGLDGAIIRQ